MVQNNNSDEKKTSAQKTSSTSKARNVTAIHYANLAGRKVQSTKSKKTVNESSVENGKSAVEKLFKQVGETSTSTFGASPPGQSDDNKTVSDIIVRNMDIRENLLGLKDADVERRAGLTSGYLSRLRKTRSVPSVDKAILIAAQLRTTVEDLCDPYMSALSAFELEQVDFLTKVKDDFVKGNIKLQAFHPDEIIKRLSANFHDMDFDCVDANGVSIYFYDSPITGMDNRITQESYILSLDEKTSLLLLSSSVNPALDETGIVEAYIIVGESTMYSFASSFKGKDMIRNIVRDLYNAIAEGSSITRAHKPVSDIMDKYLGRFKPIRRNDSL